MPTLSYKGLSDAEGWRKANTALPRYDARAAAERTEKDPAWLHFGAGNIFRGYIAALSHNLLNEGLCQTGIVPVETFDTDIVDKIYKPFDNLALLVTLRGDGGTSREVIGSMAPALTSLPGDDSRLKAAFANPSLQIVSFTITEKGYVVSAPEPDPDKPVQVMAKVAALLLHRYRSCAASIAVVSMDNCSHNGERLQNAVLAVARGWLEAGLTDAGFIEYLSDEKRVSFPWSMIDKITPRPADVICEALENDGIADMAPIITSKGTYIAPFVNAEEAQYLVIEDVFPNGRPPLERAGVYMTDRDTVNRVERMKVTTCLNPLHTALAVFGCLLGYDSIAAEMRDEDLVKLVRRIGYDEGLPVVTRPGILEPRDFLDEVVTKRLPNPFIPDMPQRIATDTSQKVPIRFGETIKAYHANKNANALTGIPLAIAGWLRYLLAVDDNLEPMAVSSDPLLDKLQGALSAIDPLAPDTGRVAAVTEPLLRDAELFGTDLIEADLGEKINGYLIKMLAGRGAVRAALKEAMS